MTLYSMTGFGAARAEHSRALTNSPRPRPGRDVALSRPTADEWAAFNASLSGVVRLSSGTAFSAAHAEGETLYNQTCDALGPS